MSQVNCLSLIALGVRRTSFMKACDETSAHETDGTLGGTKTSIQEDISETCDRQWDHVIECHEQG